MKRIILAAVLCLFFVLPGVASAQSNLLQNPNFENGINSWRVGGPSWVPETTVVRQGSISAKNTIGTIPNQDYFASLSQEFPFAANNSVYATLAVKTNINVTAFARAGVLVEFVNSSNQVLATYQDEVGGSTDWRQLYTSARAPAGTSKVRYHAFVFASQAETTPPSGIALGGLAYFDEAVLSTTPISPPPVQSSLINPSFENGYADWSFVSQPALSIDGQNSTQGSYSAKQVINVGANQDFFAAAIQDLRYLTGKVYASANIKTVINPASTGLAELKLEFYNQFNPPSTVAPLGTANATLRGNNNWTRAVIDNNGQGITPPTGTVMIRVLALTYAQQGNSAANGGVANFDEVVLSYNPLPPQYRANVLNRDFENGLNSWSEQFGFPASTSSTAYAGSLSAKKTVGVINNRDYYSQIFQDVYYNSNATPWPLSTPVSADVYVKTNMNPTTKAQAGLQFEFIDAQGQVIKNAANQPIIIKDKVGGQTPNWRRLYIAGATPAGTVRVRLSGYEFSRQQESHLGGDGFYDNFNFAKQTLLPPPPKKHYLFNRGFENGLNDWDEPYKPAEVSTSIKHSGNYAAVFTVDNEVLLGRDYFATLTQYIDVSDTEDMAYTVEGWVKTDINPQTLGVAGFLVTSLDANGQPVGSPLFSIIGGRTPWTKLKIPNIVINGGVTKLKVECAIYVPWWSATPGDKVYFDDMISP